MEKNIKEFKVKQIGFVKRENEKIYLNIFQQYKAAFKQLDKFSHVIVYWWFDKLDDSLKNKLDCYPPYADKFETGVFACRAEYRPNPIASTTCEIIKIDEENCIIEVKNIDAYDDTPIIDLKVYFPVIDKVDNAVLPEYLSYFPKSMPKEGIGIYE